MPDARRPHAARRGPMLHAPGFPAGAPASCQRERGCTSCCAPLGEWMLVKKYLLFARVYKFWCKLLLLLLALTAATLAAALQLIGWSGAMAVAHRNADRRADWQSNHQAPTRDPQTVFRDLRNPPAHRNICICGTRCSCYVCALCETRGRNLW